jgi:nucleoside-diphosphate-sugar epimerase
MAKLVLTGASGYIGDRLCEMARADGHQIVVLGRHAPPVGSIFFSWALGDEAPLAALRGANAVIHLAHSWQADTQPGDNANMHASERLARGAVAAGVPRFIFASTTSARSTARNAYGRIKYATEHLLAALPGAAGRIVSARIALVYGGVPAGQYALMRRLTALTPILPMVGLDREVQPIHLDEVCRALLTLALEPQLDRPFYVIAGEPMRFRRWLTLLRKAQMRSGLLLVPISSRLVLLACDIFPFLPRERVLGLMAAEAMPNRESLDALGIQPGDPMTLLRQEESLRGANLALALLGFLGARRVTAEMKRDLTAGLARAGLGSLRLPALLLRHPAWIALVEPPANRQTNRLAQALHLAAQVMEAHGAAPRQPGLFKTGLLVGFDLLTWPLRLLTARRYQ